MRFPSESVGELAALAVHPDFRREGYGEALMHEIEQRARKLRADAAVRADDARRRTGSSSAASAPPRSPTCPQQKQALYNYQRKSLVYVKHL